MYKKLFSVQFLNEPVEIRFFADKRYVFNFYTVAIVGL